MTSVALHEIVFDEEIYPRTAWSQSTVDRYADAMHAGEMFPPIILESGTNRLLDGMHRTEAFRAVGRDLVPVDYQEIPDGVPAKLYAASLSSRHGDPLASEDKRQVARETAISNPDFSMVLIAKLLGTTRQTVSKYVGDIAERRREVRRVRSVLLTRAGLSNRKAAEVLGVDESVVRGDVKADNPPHVSEDLLREAAADLPVDVEAIVETVLAELEVPAHPIPTQSPGPADPTTPPVDPGKTPAPAVDHSTTAPAVPPQEPDLTADVVRVLGLPTKLGLTVAEIWCRMPAGVHSGMVQAAVDGLCDAGRVLVASTSERGTRWMLTPTAEHYEASAWTGDDPGMAGVECACGLNFDGFDSPTEARVQLTLHIADATAEPEQYKADPAERIAAVAEVAPEFVRPVEPAPEALEPEQLERERRQVVKAARGHAKTIVWTVSEEVRAIIRGIDLGEQGLVTEQMIADLRAAVDLLASRLEAR